MDNAVVNRVELIASMVASSMAAICISAAKAARMTRPALADRSAASAGESALPASALAHARGKTKGCCVACRQRPACVPYELKIRKASGAPGWLLPICQACFTAVMPLSPIAELLWFQSMGVDALCAASRRSAGAVSATRRDRSKRSHILEKYFRSIGNLPPVDGQEGA